MVYPALIRLSVTYWWPVRGPFIIVIFGVFFLTMEVRNTDAVTEIVDTADDLVTFENVPNNTEAKDLTCIPVSFGTRRNPTAEITSMLSSLYLSDAEQSDDDGESSV